MSESHRALIDCGEREQSEHASESSSHRRRAELGPRGTVFSPLWIRQFYVTAALVFFLDQWAKASIRRNYPLGFSRHVIPGFISFTRVHNTGAAFGMMPSGILFLIAVSLIVCIGLIFWGKRLLSQGPWLRAALSLELGGALGNLTDRILHGHVTDFIDFDTSIKLLRDYPVFNIADIALTIGAVCIAIHLMKDMKRHG